MDVDADDREDDQMPIDDSPGTPLPDAEGDAMMVDEDGNVVDAATMEVEDVEVASEADADDMNAEPTPPLGAGPSISPFAPPGPPNVDPFSLAVDHSMPSFADEPPGSALPQGVDQVVDQVVEQVDVVKEAEHVAAQPQVLDTRGVTHETPVTEDHSADQGEEEQAQGAKEYIGEDEEEYTEGEGEEYQEGGEHHVEEGYHEGEAEEHYEEGEEDHEEGEEGHEEGEAHHEEDEGHYEDDDGHYEDDDGHYEEQQHQEEGTTREIEGEQTGEGGAEEVSPGDHADHGKQNIANGVAEQSPPEDQPAVAGPSSPRSDPAPQVQGHDEEHGDEHEGDYHGDSDFEHCDEEIEFDEEEMEHYPTDAHSLTPFILHLPNLGARSLFNPLPDGSKLPVWLDTRLEELGEGTLSDVWMEIRNEMAKEGLAQGGEMIITEKQMDLKMGEDDVNLQYITLLDLAQVHHGCGLPGPVQLYITFEPHRFITRFNAIQQEVQAQFKREEEAAEASSGDEEVVEEPDVEETDTKPDSHADHGREDYGHHRRIIEITPAEHGSHKAKHMPVESGHPNADWASTRLIQPIHIHGTRVIASPRSEDTEIFAVPPPQAPREITKDAQRRSDEREASGDKDDLSDEEKDTIEGTESEMAETLGPASLSARVTSSDKASGDPYDEAIDMGDEDQPGAKPRTPLSDVPLDDYELQKSKMAVRGGAGLARSSDTGPVFDDEGISTDDPASITGGTRTRLLDEVELAKLRSHEVDRPEPGSSVPSFVVPLDEAAMHLSEVALHRLSTESQASDDPETIPKGISTSVPPSVSQSGLLPASNDTTNPLFDVPEVPEDVEDSVAIANRAQTTLTEDDVNGGLVKAAEARLKEAEQKLQDAKKERDEAYATDDSDESDGKSETDHFGLNAIISQAVTSSAVDDLPSRPHGGSLNEDVSDAAPDTSSALSVTTRTGTTWDGTSLASGSLGSSKRPLGDDENVEDVEGTAKRPKAEW